MSLLNIVKRPNMDEFKRLLSPFIGGQLQFTTLHGEVFYGRISSFGVEPEGQEHTVLFIFEWYCKLKIVRISDGNDPTPPKRFKGVRLNALDLRVIIDRFNFQENKKRLKFVTREGEIGRCLMSDNVLCLDENLVSCPLSVYLSHSPLPSQFSQRVRGDIIGKKKK